MLQLEKHRELEKGPRRTIQVDDNVYQQLKELSKKTNYTIRVLTIILLQYAIDNVELIDKEV